MEKMKEEDAHFINSDGQKIHCKYWYPKEDYQPRLAAVLILHGVAEHCQYYQHMATTLCNENLLVFAHDHVGHGLSDGDRVHLTRGSTYVDDTVQHVNEVKQRYPNVPVFVVGHSLGGLIAMKTELDYSGLFAGVVIIGSGLVVDPKEATPFLICLVKWIAGIMPQAQLKAITPSYLTHDEEVVKRYIEDPLVWHGGLKARWGLYMLDMTRDVEERLHEITVPILILHGTDDKYCCVSGSQMVYDTVPSKNKVIKLFPGAFHSVHLETEGRQEEVESSIVSWINQILDDSVVTDSDLQVETVTVS